HPARITFEDPVLVNQADRHGIHQTVAVISRIKGNVAAHGRNADTVAVITNAFDNVLEKIRRTLMIAATKTQRVQIRHRPGAHAKNVAQNAADAGRGTLVRFDIAWVIVAFHFESRAKFPGEADNAGVFSRPLYHLLTGRRKPPKMNA